MAAFKVIFQLKMPSLAISRISHCSNCLSAVCKYLSSLQEAERAWRASLQLVPGYFDSILALARLLATTDAGGRRMKDGAFPQGKRLEQVRGLEGLLAAHCSEKKCIERELVFIGRWCP